MNKTPMVLDSPKCELQKNPLRMSEKNLIWVDMEMTGLLPEQDFIIEIAMIVTDSQLNNYVCGPVLAIYQTDRVLDKMDKWNKTIHAQTGLVDRVKKSRETEATAQAKYLDFLRMFVPSGKSPMCGNSVGQDRRFMERYMPNLAAFFHYRNLDVSVLKELAKRWYPEIHNKFKKKNSHTALSDIQESIEELRFYREKLFISSKIF